MHELLDCLVASFFRNSASSPSPLFLQSCRRYLDPSPFTPVLDDAVEKMIKRRSYRAYLIYKRIRRAGTARMLCYVLVAMCDERHSIVQELNRNVKKGALGLSVSYFTDTNITLLREHLDTHLYGIVFQIHQNACVYTKLRATASFHSKAHLNFYEIVRRELGEYERCVVEQEDELLSFYVGMYSPYIRLQIMHQLNECFRDNPRRPFGFLRLDLRSDNRFYGEMVRASSMHIDSCVREFISTGDFVDDNKEFFICKSGDACLWNRFTIDFGLVPYFVSNGVVERILYIGKCVALLREDRRPQCNEDGWGPRDYSRISVLSPSLEDDVDEVLREINRKVECVLRDSIDVYGHIESARQVFLFGRGDFIETLFSFLRDTRRVSRKSLSYILDAAIRDTYGRLDGFTSRLGVYLVDNENRYENFALLYQVDYPISLVLTREIVLKLVSVFQFLWRLKRIEHLLLRISRGGMDRHTRIRISSYTGLVHRISYFVFEEVISQKWRLSPASSTMPLDGLRVGIEKALDGIMSEGRIGEKGFEQLLAALESSLMDVGTGSSSFNDGGVQNALRGFLDTVGDSLVGTSLFDIHRYLTSTEDGGVE